MAPSLLSTQAACLAISCLLMALGSGNLSAQTSASAQSTTALSLQAELLFWESMKHSRDAAEINAYLTAYPQGRFVPLAKARLKSLTAAATDRVSGHQGAELAQTAEFDGERPLVVTASKRPLELRPGQRFRDCDVCPAMVVIPAGRFAMGSNSGGTATAPVREVAIANDLAVGIYEVSVGEWSACVSDGDCAAVPGSDTDANLPIGNLSWDDSQAYLGWLTKKTGRNYRLPSEAEWEYAARAGATTSYWWGEEPGSRNANCADCGNPGDGDGAIAVGTFAANSFGLHDVHGNLWEWTQDCWNPSYEGAPADGASWTSGDCLSRVLRGGSYAQSPEYMATWKRNHYDHDVRFFEHGLRVVSDIAAQAPEDAPFEIAVGKAVSTIFANMPASGANTRIVFDPVVDGLSGQRSTATEAMQARIAELVLAEHPQFELQDFTESTVADSQYVLIGTFTGVNKQRKPAGERQAFRICLALINRESGEIAAKAKFFAKTDNVDITPTRFFRDSPAWIAEDATQSYVKSCQATKPGGPADPRYLELIKVNALLDQAIKAYESGEYERSRGLFRAAADAPSGRQLRTYNGLYLTNWQLGDLDQAAQAFADLLDLGLEQGSLALKFRFNPGGADFALDLDRGAQNQLWLTRISKALASRDDCLDIVGHLHRNAANSTPEDLGFQRADYVKRRLQAEAPTLGERLTAMAGDPDANLIGSATDDEKDVLDRRIDFRVTTCPAKSASNH